MRTLLCIALVCLASCKAQQPMGETIEGLVLLQQDGYGGTADFKARAIREQKTLDLFYAQINRTRKPGLPVPTLDFGREMALMIHLGDQQGEKKVMVSMLSETETEMVLAVQIGEGLEDPGSQPILQPFYLYKMPLTEKRVTFKKVDL